MTVATQQQLANDIALWIAQGDLDDHLALIARACFARRDVVKGTNSFMPGRELTDTEKPVVPVILNPPNPKGPTPPGEMFVGFSKRYRYQGPGRFEYEGVFYDKAEIVGKDIIVALTKSTVALAHTRVRVTGVGPSKVQLLLVHEPSPEHRVLHAKWAAGQKVFYPKSALHLVCQATYGHKATA
jgi:hypothetical protein